eukprot:scaffold1847_cov121-Alexandrium_tamarense.AAC.2
MSHMCIYPQNFVVVGDSIELAVISIVSYFQDALASHALGMLLDVPLSIDILEGSGQELLLSFLEFEDNTLRAHCLHR